MLICIMHASATQQLGWLHGCVFAAILRGTPVEFAWDWLSACFGFKGSSSNYYLQVMRLGVPCPGTSATAGQGL